MSHYERVPLFSVLSTSMFSCVVIIYITIYLYPYVLLTEHSSPLNVQLKEPESELYISKSLAITSHPSCEGRIVNNDSVHFLYMDKLSREFGCSSCDRVKFSPHITARCWALLYCSFTLSQIYLKSGQSSSTSYL